MVARRVYRTSVHCSHELDIESGYHRGIYLHDVQRPQVIIAYGLPQAFDGQSFSVVHVALEIRRMNQHVPYGEYGKISAPSTDRHEEHG